MRLEGENAIFGSAAGSDVEAIFDSLTHFGRASHVAACPFARHNNMSCTWRVAKEGVESDHTVDFGFGYAHFRGHLLDRLLRDIAVFHLYFLQNRYHRLDRVYVPVAVHDGGQLGRGKFTARRYSG